MNLKDDLFREGIAQNQMCFKIVLSGIQERRAT